MVLELDETRRELLIYFLEEGVERLDAMESGLLALNLEAPEPETVAEIFRAVHSLKGAAGPFGLDSFCALAHQAETLLDQMRSGERRPDSRSLNLLLDTCDCLRDMLEALRGGAGTGAGQEADLLSRLQTMATSPGPPDPTGFRGLLRKHGDTLDWEIRFRPRPHLLRTGNEPMRILRELDSLGRLEVCSLHDAVPPLEELQPDELWLAWTLRLRTDASWEAIREIFSWVDEDADLEIIPLGSVAGPSSRAPESVGSLQEHHARPQLGSMRVATEKIDSLIDLVGELVIAQSMLQRINDAPAPDSLARLRDGLDQLTRGVRQLQEAVLHVRMLPIGILFDRLPRVVRELSRQLGKQVRLDTQGRETELDKTLLEGIVDPLRHLVRNAVDHGIESPQLRRNAGKPAAGRLLLRARHEAGEVVVEVSDDGVGFDHERIRAKAVRCGVVGPTETPSAEEITELLFAPGFSTAETVSSVSGRGVGLDVVRRNVVNLGGTVSARSRHGEGTCFTLRLPLTLAILDGQLLRVGAETYVVPSLAVSGLLRRSAERVRAVPGRGQVYRLADGIVPHLRLREILSIPSGDDPREDSMLIVAGKNGRRIALAVDDLLGQQQIVVKSFETSHGAMRGLSGATILADGRVAFILDVEGLIDAAREHGRELLTPSAGPSLASPPGGPP